MANKGHRNLSRFCGWVNNVTRKWEQDGARFVKPVELARQDHGSGWVLWMLRNGHRIPVNVPSWLVIDRLVMNLFHGVE